MTTTAEVRELLGPTSLPSELVDELITGASAVWLMGEPPEAIAGDLVLCHPALRATEVRAAVKRTAERGTWRLTVAAHDRPGLLAATAGVLATAGISVLSVSACAWPTRRLAILRLSVVAPPGAPMKEADWARLGTRLRRALAQPSGGDANSTSGSEPGVPVFRPLPPVQVTTTPGESGRVVLRVTAPDRVGLLWAIAEWLADRDANIEVARVGSAGDMADDTFVVDGAVDGPALVKHLSGVEQTVRVGLPSPLTAARAAADAAGHVRDAAASAAGGLTGAANRLTRGATEAVALPRRAVGAAWRKVTGH